jgi:sorbitol/mannitol transport system permease protein
MVLTSFKYEADAITTPPTLLFQPTLENWHYAVVELEYIHHLTNTIIIAGGSTLLALTLGVPAAYAFAFFPTRRTGAIMMWLMSTRMAPAIASIIPLYVMFNEFDLFDTHLGLALLFTVMNLPLVIWILRSAMVDLPIELLEAARIDGASWFQEVWWVLLPLLRPALTTATLLSLIFAWNEFFIAFNLTVHEAAPLSVYLASFKPSQALFWTKMSAAATATVLPIVIIGWIAQRHLVQGLTFGAVK